MTLLTAENKLEFMEPNLIQFSLEPATALDARMQHSIRAWRDLHSKLVDERSKDATQQEVASLLEITQPAVSVFEKSNSLGAQIGTIISYAAAIGLEIEFKVRKAEYPDLPEG